MKTISFNELLGLVLSMGLIYLLAFRSLPPQAEAAFIVLLTLIVHYFFRRAKPQ